MLESPRHWVEDVYSSLDYQAVFARSSQLNALNEFVCVCMRVCTCVCERETPVQPLVVMRPILTPVIVRHCD